ncbi:mRNA 3'-end-processing protein rna14, variant 2 [Entomophthora muscae]|uniref:mRNA 3'-end-processing protein rna14, variant 2 n=1 Tax=Entomophthora muscae TaxID=34485 RepID=A0ACC2TNU1_9FUNG|nr:mRNA 3'-end-processing protein rna14, variant 2 [Entomophthora muscae]
MPEAGQNDDIISFGAKYPIDLHRKFGLRQEWGQDADSFISQLDSAPRENQADETYSWTYWNQCVASAFKTGSPIVIRETYERLLKKYPTSVQHWIDYVDYELKNRQLSLAEALFRRCTVQVVSLDIFKLYLQYIKLNNYTADNVPRGPTERAVIAQAYEYTLFRVGFDKDSGPIWQEYISFLKSIESSNDWEQQQNIEKIRKVYHKAISIPTILIDQIWKDYETFENHINRVTAKKFISEKNAIYTISRNAFRELKSLSEPISSLKTTAPPPTWTPRELKLADDWQAYLSWEKSNPLQLENNEALNSRIIFAYNQALLCLRFYPEIWVDFASFYVKVDRKKDAASLFSMGSSALPSSIILGCAYAEFEELQKKETEAHEIYNKVIKSLTQELDSVQAKFGEKLQELDGHPKDGEQSMDGQESREIDGEVKELLRRREKIKDKQRAEIEAAKAVEVNVVKQKIALVWMCYMKSARRCEGIKGLRRVFGEARKSGNATYHVFVEAALLEYFNQADSKIPDNIFQLGQRNFPSEPGFVAQHLDYLIQKKDTNNARALFEKTIDIIPKEKALSLWEKISRFEGYLGDASNLEKTAKRVHEAYPHIPPSRIIAERLSYLDARATAEMGYTESTQRAKPKIFSNPAALDGSGMLNGKKNSLDSISSERFIRPDFSRWNSYKPSLEPTRITVPAFNPSDFETNSPQPPNPPVPAALPNPFQEELPEAVSYFLSQIPPPQEYTGPTINVDQVLQSLDEFSKKMASGEDNGHMMNFVQQPDYPGQLPFPPPYMRVTD